MLDNNQCKTPAARDSHHLFLPIVGTNPDFDLFLLGGSSGLLPGHGHCQLHAAHRAVRPLLVLHEYHLQDTT